MKKDEKTAIAVLMGVAAPFIIIGACVTGSWTAKQVKHAHKVWTLPERFDEHLVNQKTGDNNQDKRLGELETKPGNYIIVTNSVKAYDFKVVSPTNITVTNVWFNTNIWTY